MLKWNNNVNQTYHFNVLVPFFSVYDFDKSEAKKSLQDDEQTFLHDFEREKLSQEILK